METIRCPYCECKVLMSDVEDEDGACPECGAPLLGSLFMDDGFADGADPGGGPDLDLDVDADLPDDDLHVVADVGAPDDDDEDEDDEEL
jgi:DNA-directed RNA polymerase subunit RPC12/RpoP